MTKPPILTHEEWWYSTDHGKLVHYGVSDSIKNDDWAWYDWVNELSNYKGKDLYDRHVEWYKVRFSKLGQALK